MKKMLGGWMVLAMLACAATAQAQSQYQTTFEVGVGYARPGIGRFDMMTLLLQGDDFIFESGLGFDINGSPQDSDKSTVSWLIRAAARPVVSGNTIVHVGGEFSLHTNAARNSDGEIKTLTSVGLLIGVSQQVADHLNVEMHIFPFVLDFGNPDTGVRLVRAQLGAHMLF
jgi:hypothetical protein